MSAELHPALREALLGHFLESRSWAYALLQPDGTVTEAGGDLERFGAERLVPGADVGEALPPAFGLLPVDERGMRVPRVHITDRVAADLYLFPITGGCGLVLLETTEEERREAAVVRRVNELALRLRRHPGGAGSGAAYAPASGGSETPDRRDADATGDRVGAGEAWLALFQAMNIAVAERRPDRSVAPLAGQPSWFHRLRSALRQPQEGGGGDPLHVFLGAFLDDAHAFWDTDGFGCLKSGIWIEEDSAGEEILYEATAVNTPDLHLLLIERDSHASRDTRAIIQKGRELALSHHAVDRQRRRLVVASDALEERVREKEILLEAIFEASPLPIVVADTDLRVCLWNPAAEKVFGWSATEVLGNPLPMGGAGRSRRRDPILPDILAGRLATGREVRRQRRDGAVLTLRLSGAALLDPEGTPAAALAVFEDITDQRLVEAHLQHVQRLDALGRLAGGIAHDFNNLIGVIRAEMDLALADTSLSDGLRESLSSVRQTADRGAALTRQLLAFARRQPMRPEVIDINRVVVDLERMLRRLIEDRIRLSLQLGTGVGCANADRGQLEQVLTNLVVNARDAIVDAGEITISTGSEPPSPGTSTHPLDAEDWAAITVTDTGSGIPEGIRARIFEPFFSTKAPGRGTGLGLTTSYGIVQGMGGVLSVESELGAGSAFHVHLPRVPDPGAAAPRESPTTVAGGTELVLLVEDHAELASAARRILVRHGYTVYTAGDAAEAWSVIEELRRPPDLLFTDAHLPTGDGLELIRRFREQYPDLKVLLTSGSSEGVEVDPHDVPFIAKPYTLASLGRAVRAALDG